MINNYLTADSTNIVSIQLNLFDFCGGSKDFDRLLNEKITGYTDLNLENNVVLTNPNHFKIQYKTMS